MPDPKPRTITAYGATRAPWLGERDTWIEAEEAAYGSSQYGRRCRARRSTDDKLVVVRCGIPDTAFSIPVRGGGWIESKDGVFLYHPKKTEA